jgi:hypothetical protein
MIGDESRPIWGPCGYARRCEVGALTVVWAERSEGGARVFRASVVKKRILEGKR